MKTLILILGLSISSYLVFGQTGQLTDDQVKKSGAIQLAFVDNLAQVTKLAHQDIANGTPFLLLQGGISPIVYMTDKKFENNYKVYYYDWGCTGPNETFSVEYNKIIFRHLTEKHGQKWEEEIRKDVIGFQK